MSDVRTVAGTTFTFPDLPPRGEVDPAVYDSIMDRRAAVVAAARRRGGRTCAGGWAGEFRYGFGYRSHTCANPAACTVAKLTRHASWSGEHRPGARVTWEQDVSDDARRDLVTRTGEVWDRAPGNANWVVPDVPLEQDRLWGLPCVPAADLRAVES